MDEAVGGDEWNVLNEALRDQQPVETVAVAMRYSLDGGDMCQRDWKDIKAVALCLVEDEWLNRLREAEFAEAAFDAPLPRADEADVHLILRSLNGGQGRRAEFSRRQQEPEQDMGV